MNGAASCGLNSVASARKIPPLRSSPFWMRSMAITSNVTQGMATCARAMPVWYGANASTPPNNHTPVSSCSESAASLIFFFQAEDGIRAFHVTGVQTCALPISDGPELELVAGEGERAGAVAVA